MEGKICKHCGDKKALTEFNRSGWKDCLQPYCKPCDKARKKEWYEKNRVAVRLKAANKYKEKIEQNPNFLAEEYAKNRDKILQRNKEQAKRFKEKINERQRGYRKLDKYKQTSAKYAKEYIKKKLQEDPDLYKKVYIQRLESLDSKEKKDLYNAKQRAFKRKHRERYKHYVLSDEAKKSRTIRNREWIRFKKATDISFKIGVLLRSRTRSALKAKGVKKLSATEKLLGCPIQEFKIYFGSLFKEGMTWEHFMRGEIHIDHVVACKHFDLSQIDQQMKCFYYKNLQPLWRIDNLKKGSKIPKDINLEKWMQEIR